MTEMQFLQSVILGLAGWNLLQTHLIIVRLAKLEQAVADLPCPGKSNCTPNP